MQRTPVSADKSGTAVYRLNQSLPIWLGTRSDEKTASPESPRPPGVTSTGVRDEAQSHSRKDIRIVAWGFLVPMDGELWRIALAVSGSKPAEKHALSEIPLPSGAIPGFTIRFGDGTMLRTFHGEQVRKAAWMAHFDTWLENRGWSADAKWQIRIAEAVRHYRRGDRVEDSAWNEFLYVALQDDAGTTRGFLMHERPTDELRGVNDGGSRDSSKP